MAKRDYHCAAHGHFRSRGGWEYHAGWCETAWGVVEREIARVESAREFRMVERPAWADAVRRDNEGRFVARPTTVALMELAKANELNPWESDWGTDLDKSVCKDFLER